MQGCQPVDAIVAGAGLAGAAAACGLAQLGLRVLVIDPGPSRGRQLGGELIQPGGIAALDSLGLLEPLMRAGPTPTAGFAVCRTEGSLRETAVLDYPSGSGQALDREAMGRALRDALSARPGVEVRYGARVTGLDAVHSDAITVTVEQAGSRERTPTGLLVAADGRHSAVRRAVRLPAAQGPHSVMLGYTLHDVEPPHPGYGHLFIGGPGPVFAYPLDAGRMRLMMDVAGPPVVRLSRAALQRYAAVLPTELVGPMEQAVATQAPLVGSTQTMAPVAAGRGRVVLLGDAAGCCHPLSASGLSFCARDALWLQEAVRRAQGDGRGVSMHYARLRARSQRARMLFATILYDVFGMRSPASRLLCAGTFHHWRRSPRGRHTTMSMLATQEDRLSVLAREYLCCIGRCVPSLADPSAWTPARRGEAAQVLAGLVGDSWRYLRCAVSPSVLRSGAATP